MHFQLPAFRPSSQRLVSLPGVSSHSLLTVKVRHFLLPTHLTDSSPIIPSLLSQPAPECTFVSIVCQAPAKCWVDKAEDRLLCVSIVDGQADGNFNRRMEPDEVPRPDVLQHLPLQESPHTSTFTPCLTPFLACSGYSKTCTKLN